MIISGRLGNEAGSVFGKSVNNNKILYQLHTANDLYTPSQESQHISEYHHHIEHLTPLPTKPTTLHTMLNLQENLMQQTWLAFLNASQTTISRAISNVLDVVLYPHHNLKTSPSTVILCIRWNPCTMLVVEEC